MATPVHNLAAAGVDGRFFVFGGLDRWINSGERHPGSASVQEYDRANNVSPVRLCPRRDLDIEQQ